MHPDPRAGSATATATARRIRGYRTSGFRGFRTPLRACVALGRCVGAAVSRPKGSKAARIEARWDAALAPAQASSGSLKAQSGDQVSIGVGTLDGNGAGETLDLADVPTC